MLDPAALLKLTDAHQGRPAVTFRQARHLSRLLNRRQWKRAAVAAAALGLTLTRRGAKHVLALADGTEVPY